MAGNWFALAAVIASFFRHPVKPDTVTVAGKASLDVPVGTLESILKQAGLKKE
jgi:predicted RNA binding protein YcfA (HicA-like mRNA interferase family)